MTQDTRGSSTAQQPTVYNGLSSYKRPGSSTNTYELSFFTNTKSQKSPEAKMKRKLKIRAINLQ